MNTYNISKLSTLTLPLGSAARKSTSAKTKSTALKKRLNLVFQNCEMIFILADAKQAHAQYIEALPFESRFMKKVFFPKHALNNFCLNFHMPIQGCHLDLLAFSFIENQSSFNHLQQKLQKQKSQKDLLLKTHMLALLAMQIFKIEMLSPQLSMPGHSRVYLPRHFNQLCGALVKTKSNLFFYIGHAEIKQTLLLQQHLKPVESNAKLLLHSKVLMLQSFRKTFSNLEYLLLTQSQFHTLLLKKLTFFLIYLKFNLLSFIVLKQNSN